MLELSEEDMVWELGARRLQKMWHASAVSHMGCGFP
jgi:hypothetical protein